MRREGALAPTVALDVVGQVLAGLSDAHAERGDNWRGRWGYTWYKSRPSSTYKLNRVQLYSHEPVSVTVAGKDQGAQDKALASLEPYRDPAQLRGVPIG